MLVAWKTGLSLKTCILSCTFPENLHFALFFIIQLKRVPLNLLCVLIIEAKVSLIHWLKRTEKLRWKKLRTQKLERQHNKQLAKHTKLYSALLHAEKRESLKALGFQASEPAGNGCWLKARRMGRDLCNPLPSSHTHASCYCAGHLTAVSTGKGDQPRSAVFYAK